MVISPTNKRFLVAYVLLVGLPLLGLVGVLKAGRGATAPISVDGNWKIAAASASASDASCAKSLSSIEDSLLTISQSGTGLVLGLDSASKSTTSGAIDGTTISAALPQADGVGETCGLTLLASVDPKSEPRSMTGTLSINGCPSCSPLPWRAVRQARTTPKGIH